MIELSCEICGKSFLSKSNQAKYCSDECRKLINKSIEKDVCRRKRATRQPKISIYEVIEYAKKLTEETGKYVSYGQASAMLEGLI